MSAADTYFLIPTLKTLIVFRISMENTLKNSRSDPFQSFFGRSKIVWPVAFRSISGAKIRVNTDLSFMWGGSLIWLRSDLGYVVVYVVQGGKRWYLPAWRFCHFYTGISRISARNSVQLALIVSPRFFKQLPSGFFVVVTAGTSFMPKNQRYQYFHYTTF